MKSVGEAMAIGRTVHESLQKALSSMETGLSGFDEIEIEGAERTAPRQGRRHPRAVAAHARPDAHHRAGHAPRAER